jgi:O-methyltransferase
MTPTDRYLHLLEETLLDAVYEPTRHDSAPVTLDEVDKGAYWPKRGLTMIGRQRLLNIKACMMNIITDNIRGDLVETGVWRGGACIYMKALCEVWNQNRRVFVCDSFEGLPPREDRYPIDGKNTYDALLPYLKVSLEEVQNNFKKFDLLDQKVVFVKGWFEQSLYKISSPIAILRLDGDMYSSTITVLNQLYDSVSPGGYIIVDDYDLLACRQAVDDFRSQRLIHEPMERIDWTGSFWRKPFPRSLPA